MANVTYSSTKAQIWNAYKALLKDKKQLEKVKATAVAATTPAVDAPSDVAGVISGLEQLGVGFRESVGSLQERLVGEASRLSTLREAAGELRLRLMRDHGIEVSEDSLATLLEEDAKRIEAADAAFSTREATHAAEMEVLRAEWAAASSTHDAAVAERDGDRAVAVEREQAAYRYDLERRRAADADAYTQAKKVREKALATFEADTRAAWTAREEAVDVREEELVELEAKAEAFPAERDAAVERARVQGRALALKQAETEAKLRGKAFEGRQRLASERIEALETTIATQKAQLDRLGAQLEAALEQAQQLAVKALEGAANATSYNAVREIAMEQARNTKNGK